jgi:xanthine dehydrogenase accessory factor
MKDIYEEIVDIKQKGERAAVATILSSKGSTPREQGSKMLVRSDGSISGSIGGGKLEALVIAEALKVMQSGKIANLHFDLSAKDAGELGMICGGETDILIEPIIPLQTIYIFGAGHISIPLCIIGKLLHFRVVVIDDREEYASRERFPQADAVHVLDFKNIATKLDLNMTSYLIIVTRGHASDEVVLEQVVKLPVAYIGMIGSRSKVKAILDHLKAEGVEQEMIDRVHSPIGLKINAETPEEIAVSIMAEIIAVMRAED